MRINKAEAFGTYVEGALWSSTDDCGIPLDRNYQWFHITIDGLTTMWMDVVNFIEENQELMSKMRVDGETCGHNFWLSRNGHGAGFFDRGSEPEWQKLQAQAMKYGEQHLLVNPQKMLDVYPG